MKRKQRPLQGVTGRIQYALQGPQQSLLAFSSLKHGKHSKNTCNSFDPRSDYNNLWKKKGVKKIQPHRIKIRFTDELHASSTFTCTTGNGEVCILISD